MSKIFSVVFLIFGTVVGSGFSSGKEIVVFFSRFGNASYFFILLACLMFFALFYFFLRSGHKVVEKIENNKFANALIVLISVVFCANMFAGMESLFGYFPTWLYAILVAVLIFGSVLISLRGIAGLEKVNTVLMPLTVVAFLAVLLYGMKKSSALDLTVNSLAGILYSPLYVALNTSMSGFVISRCGKDLTKKQAFLSSLFSALLLFVFLMLGNFVLLKNSGSFVSDMPFLYLVQDCFVMFVLDFVVILLGCFTTLVSLSFTLKTAFAKFVKNELLSSVLAVFLPFLLSGLGFSHIVSFLYPVCSVLGISVLLFFILSFKQTDKKIHSKHQNT